MVRSMRRPASGAGVLLALTLVACGDSGKLSASGGASASGGVDAGTAARGGTSSGGTAATSSGGASAAGGTITAGGTSGAGVSGGTTSGGTTSGGASGSAGSGGIIGTGGIVATGGAGGATGGTGGIIGTGGIVATGGTGGIIGTGGSGGAGGACADCGFNRTCCGDECVSTYNDPRNCGTCGVTCASGTYCAAGHCENVPCSATCASGQTCCGGACCAAGQICCDPAMQLSGGVVCKDPNAQGTCPPGCAPLCACASPDTPIATPTGERAIGSLVVGDLVYSAHHGALAVVPVAQVHRTPVKAHQVVRVVLATGRVLDVSAGHPTADGRTFADLAHGGQLDGIAVASARLVPYAYPYTVDILPSSDSGTYVAAGVLIGSTLSDPNGCH
jgi:hypothetical protein